MKLLSVLVLVVSLAVNAALMTGLLRRGPALESPSGGAPAALASARDAKAAAGATVVATNKVSASQASASVRAPDASSTLWERLASPDPAQFLANLRTAGFSVGAARGAVYALLRENQNDERKRAVDALPVEPFWKAGTPLAASAEYNKEITRMWLERAKTMRDLFPEEAEAFKLQMATRYGPLSPDTYERLAALEKDYSEMRLQLSAQSRSAQLRMPWDTDKLAYLELEKRNDMSRLMTPAELEQYDLRSSPTAMSMRRQLVEFAPNEQEYRAIYAARAAYDGKLSANAPFADTTDARRELAARLKAELGDQRYADYERLFPASTGIHRVAP